MKLLVQKVIVAVVYIFRNFDQYIFTKFNKKIAKAKEEAKPQGHALPKRTCS